MAQLEAAAAKYRKQSIVRFAWAPASAKASSSAPAVELSSKLRAAFGLPTSDAGSGADSVRAVVFSPKNLKYAVVPAGKEPFDADALHAFLDELIGGAAKLNKLDSDPVTGAAAKPVRDEL